MSSIENNKNNNNGLQSSNLTTITTTTTKINLMPTYQQENAMLKETSLNVPKFETKTTNKTLLPTLLLPTSMTNLRLGSPIPIQFGTNNPTTIMPTEFRIKNLSTTTIQQPTPLKTPPLICEQGPSAPPSPTTPSERGKRPSPLSVDALQRFDLLSPNYVPSTIDYSNNKQFLPLSPCYTTSDLGSSPRSSISFGSGASASGLLNPNWSPQTRNGGKKSITTSDYGGFDADSDIGGSKDFLNSGFPISPAPYSPFSDYHSETAYSSRSPNLSPLPTSANKLHFNFEQTRSRSSMSNRDDISDNPSDNNSNEAGGSTRRRKYYQKSHHNPLHCDDEVNVSNDISTETYSLDADARHRCRSEGEILKRSAEEDAEADDDDEGIKSINHSTYSIPTTMNRNANNHGIQYKKRLLMKYHREQQANNLSKNSHSLETDKFLESGSISIEAEINSDLATSNNTLHDESQQTSDLKIINKLIPSCSHLPPSANLTRQPTIEEPPPSPTFAELFHSRDLGKERQTQVEEWIRQQTAVMEIFRNSLVPFKQEANLLQVPNAATIPPPPNSSAVEHITQLFTQPTQNRTNSSTAGGPMRPPTLWRRSRSESDVSVPINDAAYICKLCGQGFSMHDRLAKHIASRHRDRSVSCNDENNKIHKCTLCTKSFGRSDMLTRHMRLHTGLKPYACQICNQVFSRSDHLSTHLRVHTGEKPYRCPHCSYAASRRDMITRHMRTHVRPDGSPIPFSELLIPPIAQLSLNQSTTPEPESLRNCSVSPLPPPNSTSSSRASLNPSPLPLSVVTAAASGITPLRKNKKKSSINIKNDKNLTVKLSGPQFSCPSTSNEDLNITDIGSINSQSLLKGETQPMDTSTPTKTDKISLFTNSVAATSTDNSILNNNCINPNLIFSTLHGSINEAIPNTSITTDLRRTNSLLLNPHVVVDSASSLTHPHQRSAFRPLLLSSATSSFSSTNLIVDSTTSMNIAAATAAMSKFISCVQANTQQQKTNTLKSNNSGQFPGLFRQNSIGGYDFEGISINNNNNLQMDTTTNTQNSTQNSLLPNYNNNINLILSKLIVSSTHSS